jgi:hypothetical protein
MERAKAICTGRNDSHPCPVILQCREYAEENNLLGCWGGQVRSQRDFMKVAKRVEVLRPVLDARLKRAE